MSERVLDEVLNQPQQASTLEQRIESVFERAKVNGLLDPDLTVGRIAFGSSPAPEARDIFGYKREAASRGVGATLPAAKLERMLRIESDGTPEGTKVYLGAVEIAMIQEVSWKVAAGAAVPEVTIKALLADIKIVSNKEEE